MGVKEVAEKLHPLDPEIERLFKKAMQGKKADDKLGVDFADLVFTKVMKDTKIITKEAEALVVLIENDVFSDAARQHLIARLAKESGDAVERGATRLTKGNADLNRFNSAFEMRIVRSITFWSPGTLHWYRPLHYLAIRQLVESESITVWSMDTAGLSRYVSFGFSGEYIHAANAFIINRDRMTDKITLVHEATHAIQDWRDFVSDVKFLEADAYIAEAVVASELNPVFMSAEARWAIDGDLVDMVVNNAATQGNKKWETIYKDMVTQVMRDPIYGAKVVDPKTKREFIPGDERFVLREKRGPNEKEQMEKLKHALNKKFP